MGSACSGSRGYTYRCSAANRERRRPSTLWLVRGGEVSSDAGNCCVATLADDASTCATQADSLHALTEDFESIASWTKKKKKKKKKVLAFIPLLKKKKKKKK